MPSVRYEGDAAVDNADMLVVRPVLILPTYNNAGTIGRVVEEASRFLTDIIVVNDGSTDQTSDVLRRFDSVSVVEYPDCKNRGKGYAIRQGLRLATERGYTHAITFDTDGQHFADDIPTFIEYARAHPETLVVGARNLNADGMPGKNTFANKFSNFWFRVETLQSLADTQSGFRLYPLKPMDGMRLFCNRYEFEVEVLVRAACRGISVVNIPIKVCYPEDRVSHFRPLRDFGRISLLNTCLCLGAFFYYYPLALFRRVRKSLREASGTPGRTSAAIGVGTMMSVLPVWGFQTVIALALAHLFRLDKVIVVVFATLSLPQFIPFIVYGGLLTGCRLLDAPLTISSDGIPADFSWLTFLELLGSLARPYFVGGTVVALCAGLVAFAVARACFWARAPRRE